jgi:hypothetical protein
MRQTNHFDSYGVFCVAMTLTDEQDLDIRWMKAILLYKQFVDSPYNNTKYPELDCLYEFLKYKKESNISE